MMRMFSRWHVLGASDDDDGETPAKQKRARGRPAKQKVHESPGQKSSCAGKLCLKLLMYLCYYK